jgi:hypothetical protein
VRLQNIVIDPSMRRLFFGGGVEHRDETAWLSWSVSPLISKSTFLILSVSALISRQARAMSLERACADLRVGAGGMA